MNEQARQSTCAERVSGRLAFRLDELRAMLDTCPGCESYPGEVGMGDSGDDCSRCLEMIEQGRQDQEGDGGLWSYGLSFDYVAPGTWEDQNEGYWRFLLSSGGPSDEFRFYASFPDAAPYRVEFWFMDWFDGASRLVTSEPVILDVWSQFQDVEAVRSEFDKAMED